MSTLLSSGLRTADTPSPAQSGFSGDLWLLINVTALSATPDVTPKLQIQDPESGEWAELWAAASPITDVTGVKTYVYFFSGGNFDESTILDLGAAVLEKVTVRWGGTMRLFMDHGDADSITYSASYDLAA